MSNYKLINPYIEGNMNSSFSANSGMDAAEKTWSTLSKHITNIVPQFAFTLENTSDGSFSHFLVKEKIGDKNSVNYNISELDKIAASGVKNFKKKLDNFVSSRNLSGGKKHKRHHRDEDDSSSTDSSSSSDIFRRMKLHQMLNAPQPITYWWYDPLIYKLDSVFIPTFVAPINPYVEVTTLYIT